MMKMPRPAIYLPFLLALSAIPFPALAEEKLSSQELQFFENKVRPLLVERCYKCHSAGRKAPKAELFLDNRQGVLEGGESGPAIVPGKPSRSLLIEAIRYENPDLQMPPKKKLVPAEIAVLEKWVEMGAPDPRTGENPASKDDEAFDVLGRKRSHWSWSPINHQEAPEVKNAQWPRSGLDRFVLAGLEKAGINPNPDASRRTLIKRAYYALTGLPPAIEEVEKFVADKSPGAFSALVDKLLKSPHFGEHWGQYWLDLVRFAETKGHEADYPIPEAWRYRDYVIRSLNADVPYDQWIKEHLAGDLISEPRIDPELKTNESIQGTGFWHLGEATHSPVDIRGEEAERIHNQIDVFSKTFLGLSVGCARCHDHKFDAITQKDYYAMYGYIQSSGFQLADVLEPVRKRNAAEALRKLRSSETQKIYAAFSAGMRTRLQKFPVYLEAAAEVLRLGPLEGASAPDTSDILFEDFEKATYDGWTVKGQAFGRGPRSQRSLPEHQGDVAARGRGFVNSHSHVSKGKVNAGDNFIGSMLSAHFKVERRFINLLVGGGPHKDQTCVDLVINGKPVASVVGPSSNKMVARSMDVSAWSGARAQLRILDNSKGGWGNIGADHIVFSNKAAAGPSEAGEDSGLAGRVSAVAGKRKLQAEVLKRVVAHVERARKDLHDPLHAFAELSGAADAASAEKARSSIVEQLEKAEREHQGKLAGRKVISNVKNGERNYLKVERKWSEKKDLVVDYNRPGREEWIVSGHRFGPAPLASGDLLIGSEGRPVKEFVPTGRADADEASRKFYGMLRTPTFEVVGDTIWYRVRGSCDAFLAVDSHRTVHGPLHGGVRKRIKGDPKTWRWHSHAARNYLGHRIHIEFSNFSENFAVGRVEFNAGAPVDASPVNKVGLQRIARLKDLKVQGLARVLSDQLAASLGALAPGASETAERGDHARLLNWALERKDLFEDVDSGGLGKLVSAYRKSKAEIEKSIPGALRTLALLDGNGENEPLHIRGNHKNRSPKTVQRSILTALKVPGKKTGAPSKGSGRLDLARRLADRNNPLVARVMVNRIWHHLFGRGIVESCDDFGVMGSTPSHPELLDWLAFRFMEKGWSIKDMIRTILVSRAYGMSSVPQKRGDEVDPQNKLLHRMAILRLPAEAIRDKVLAVSGRLDRRLFGKGVMVHITEFMRGNRSPGGSGPVDGNGRRSIYTEVRRNHLSAMLLAFDRPVPFMTMGKRVLSNSPAQALILLNDPFVHQQVDIWSKQLLAQGGLDDKALLRQAYGAAFHRAPRAAEVSAAVEFLKEQGRLYPQDSRTRAWKDLLHTLMNVKEFIFIN